MATLWGIELPRPMLRVQTSKRTIGQTVWGRAWCTNLERHGDFENRLPRGRTYLRKGGVWHLEIAEGRVNALVMGKTLYQQEVRITPLDADQRRRLIESCQGEVRAALDLIQGRLPGPILENLKNPRNGVLPEPGQIEMTCSCPDWAYLCKHLAAVLYGVGVRLDERPELLFTLRGINPSTLVQSVPDLFHAPPPVAERRLARTDLGALFDLDLEDGARSTADNREEAPLDRASPRTKNSADTPLTITRSELMELGVSAGQVSRMLRSRELLKSDRRGTYRLTPTAWDRIQPLLGTREK